MSAPAFPNKFGDMGLTIRDYFAAKAMQSILMDERYSNVGNEAANAYEVSRYAGRIADAMLAERQKGQS